MPKPPLKTDQLRPDQKLAFLDGQIALHTKLVERLAAQVEAAANRLGREPTRSEEEAVNAQRRELRRYLRRRQLLKEEIRCSSDPTRQR